MKLLVSLIIFSLISFAYSSFLYSSNSGSGSSSSSSSSSSSGNYKYGYIKTEMFNPSISSSGSMESTCEGEIIGSSYLKNGICGFEGISRVVCEDDGSIVNYIYSDVGCSGKIKQAIHVEPNNCTNTNEKYVCSETIDVPSNTYQVVYTHGKCEDDPDWKDSIWQFAYNVLDYCIYSSTGSVILQCNQTIAIENIYNSTTSCSDTSTGYSYLEVPKCTKKNSYFSICDSDNNSNSI